ncbi:MAG: putative monovalent cation/H+ antiporter, subunit B [Nitrospira sp.]|nr:MAG: putative monovalent cation/H+ antiporter, subunit B [Nitrospira sp.]
MIAAHDSLIVHMITRVLLPVIQLYGIYVLFFGQYGPGGGFVGGVIFGASLILTLLVFGARSNENYLAKRALRADGLGLIIYAGIGGLCMIFAGQFLNYSAVPLPGFDPPATRSLGILGTMIGVAVDIAVTSISIVDSLSFADEEGRLV